MRLLHCSLIFISLLPQLHASCGYERYTLTELLLHDGSQRSIFLCSVQETGMITEEYTYRSRVQVTEVLKGRVDSARVYVVTGGFSTAGGQPLEPGSEWLIVSRPSAEGYYAATVCDFFSCTKNHGERFYGILALIRAWKKAVDDRYTGAIYWYFGNGQTAATGRMKNGLAEGEWRHYRPDGALKSIAHYRRGKRHGALTNFGTDGQGGKEISEYRANSLTLVTTFYPDGQRRSRLVYGKKSELGVWVKHESFHPNGRPNLNATYEASIPDIWFSGGHHRPHGQYVEYDSNGQVVNKGRYLLGAKVGRWTETPFESTTRIDTTYQKPARPNAPLYRFFANGTPAFTGQLLAGKMSGIWTFYTTYGQKSKDVTYLNGLKHGPDCMYAGEEQKSVLEEYRDGMLDGQVLYFFENGSVSSRTTFSNGLQHGEAVSYWPSGSLKRIAHYQQGLLNGPVVELEMNGDTAQVWHYERGLRQGIARETDRSTREAERKTGRYYNGYRVGEWLTYDKSGRLLRRCRYKMPQENGWRDPGFGVCETVK